jgi:hypothetical protein
MGLKILCSGHLVRHPVGGHSWHHLQYLVGFQRLGHEVTFFEDYGWPSSCYDPRQDVVTSDPTFGITYVQELFHHCEFGDRWCYLAEDGTTHGMSRADLTQTCRECDAYFNLSNINWIPELEHCRRRALVDTDPVFTQIGHHGLGGPFSRYDTLFTYGENVHRRQCTMPTGGACWLPTRQPVVLDLWPVQPGNPAAAFSTVTNWTPLPACTFEGREYGQKDREFVPFFSLPSDTAEPMEMALAGAPAHVRERLLAGGWRLTDPLEVTRTPWSYQHYLRKSRAEFSVAKHGYVSTRCGWFSDRSAGYLASGRPVVLQDTGFSDFLPTGEGLMAYRTSAEAVRMMQQLKGDYPAHCRAARDLAEECFDARRVLTELLERCL